MVFCVPNPNFFVDIHREANTQPIPAVQWSPSPELLQNLLLPTRAQHQPRNLYDLLEMSPVPSPEIFGMFCKPVLNAVGEY